MAYVSVPEFLTVLTISKETLNMEDKTSLFAENWQIEIEVPALRLAEYFAYFQRVVRLVGQLLDSSLKG